MSATVAPSRAKLEEELERERRRAQTADFGPDARKAVLRCRELRNQLKGLPNA